MLNIFAFRATDPKVMKAEEDPIGPENDRWIQEVASKAGLVIAAWGVHGAHMNRGQAVVEMVPGLHHLGLTKHGFPRHPLYLRADTKPEPLRSK